MLKQHLLTDRQITACAESVADALRDAAGNPEARDDLGRVGTHLDATELLDTASLAEPRHIPPSYELVACMDAICAEAGEGGQGVPGIEWDDNGASGSDLAFLFRAPAASFEEG